MKRPAERLYLARKLGSGMGLGYILRSFTPLVLIATITTALVFALVFVFSISEATDRMIALLGSGSLYARDPVPCELLPEGTTIDKTISAEGILYSEDGRSIAFLKGVEEGYFSSERLAAINLDIDGGIVEGKWIILSKSLADILGIECGDKMTLLLYESNKSRTRPVLMNVVGIFDSGYSQLDRYMAYTNIAAIAGDVGYEILLPVSSDTIAAKMDLAESGFATKTYQELYPTLYRNIQESMWILYVILVAIALLAAFFSIDIAQVYIARDRRDIAILKVLGMGRNAIMGIYKQMVLVAVCIAMAIGSVLGLVMGSLSPQIIKLVSSLEPAMLDYYITTFSVSIPWIGIAFMGAMMILLSYISLSISLRMLSKKTLDA